MNCTDDQLKQLLAKMLPETVDWREIKNCSVGTSGSYFVLCWKRRACVFDTELLHICSLVEAGLTDSEYIAFAHALNEAWMRDVKPQSSRISLCRSASATWQQRTAALAELKGVTW